MPQRSAKTLTMAVVLLTTFVAGGLWPLAALENGDEINLQQSVFNLALITDLTPGILDLYLQTARSTDFAWLEPGLYNLSEELARSQVIFRLETTLSALTLPAFLRARCEYFALGEEASLSDAVNLKALANFYGKKTALAPDGDRALADDSALTSMLAPYANLFIIRAEHWLERDVTPDLDLFLENVHSVAEAARAANPGIRLHVWLGRSDSGDRLTVEKLYQALSRLMEVYPQDLSGFGIGRPDVWNDPQHGNNLLAQTHFFIRRKSFVPPGAPQPPLDFKAAALGYSDVLLTWTDASSSELGFLLKRGQIPGRPPSATEGPSPGPNENSSRDAVPSPGTYYYRLCAYNAQGLSSFSEMQAVNTLGGGVNLPPRFDAAPSVTVHEGVPLDLWLTASDPEGEPLTYALSIHPAGMVIDPASGTVSWLPAAAGRYVVSATVSDGHSADFLWFEVDVIGAM